MTHFQQIVIIAACALATMITRFLPFFIFSEKRPTPRFIMYLGKALPSAVFGMLVVYCLKNNCKQRFVFSHLFFKLFYIAKGSQCRNI